MNIVKEFDDFKAELKEKYLDYCEANQDMLYRLYSNGTIPYEYILIIVSSIEPQVIPWLNFYLCNVSNNQTEVSNVVVFFELNFNYKFELSQRLDQRQKAEEISPPSLLDDIRQQHQKNQA